MPHTDETFYKMAVNWTEDPKVVALTRFGPVDALLGAHLFSQMIAYSRRNLTDGWVPSEELGRLMYPLPPDHAERLAQQLADPGVYGQLISPHANGNADSTAAGMQAASSWHVIAYPKWNDTRADVQARADQGRRAAQRRWSGDHAPGSARWTPSSILTASGQQSSPHTEVERERDTPLPPARRNAHSTGRARSSSPVQNYDTAQQAVAAAHRAGGPTADVQGWAAKARAGITKPEDTPTGPVQDQLPGPMNQGPALEPGRHIPPDTDPEPAQQDPSHSAPQEPAEDEIPF